VNGGHEFTSRHNRVLTRLERNKGRKREDEDEEEGARIQR
jgi:hypothetical protein